MLINDDREGVETQGDEGLEEILDGSPWADVLKDAGHEDPEVSEDDEEDLDDPKGDESVEVLHERLKMRNRQIRQNKKAVKRMQQDIEELQRSPKGTQLTPELIAALRGGQQEGAKSDEDSRAELLEQMRDDPLKVIDLFESKLSQLEDKVVQALQRRDQAFEQKLKKPVPAEITSAVSALKRLPQYSGFTDEQLEVVAKDTLPVLKRVSRPPVGYTGGSGGFRMKQGGEAQKNSILEKLGYGS